MRLDTALINLDGSDARLEGATALLNGLGLGFQRLAAFDGRGVAPADLPDHDAAETRRRFGRYLSGGEVGCYQSHLRAAERFLAGEARYGLVLEDDLGVTPDTAAALQAMLDWLDRNPGLDWDLANLGARVVRSFVPVDGYSGPGTLCHAFYFPVTTTAILWSRKGAAGFLAEGRPILLPVDHFFRKWASASGRGLAFRKAIFPDRQEESLINQDAARQKTKRPWTAWFHRQRQLLAYKATARHSMNRFRKQK